MRSGERITLVICVQGNAFPEETHITVTLVLHDACILLYQLQQWDCFCFPSSLAAHSSTSWNYIISGVFYYAKLINIVVIIIY